MNYNMITESIPSFPDVGENPSSNADFKITAWVILLVVLTTLIIIFFFKRDKK